MFVLFAPAAQDLGVGLRRPCREQGCGGMLGARARVAPSQPNEAMARIAPQLPVRVDSDGPLLFGF